MRPRVLFAGALAVVGVVTSASCGRGDAGDQAQVSPTAVSLATAATAAPPRTALSATSAVPDAPPAGGCRLERRRSDLSDLPDVPLSTGPTSTLLPGSVVPGALAMRDGGRGVAAATTDGWFHLGRDAIARFDPATAEPAVVLEAVAPCSPRTVASHGDGLSVEFCPFDGPSGYDLDWPCQIALVDPGDGHAIRTFAGPTRARAMAMDDGGVTVLGTDGPTGVDQVVHRFDLADGAERVTRSFPACAPVTVGETVEVGRAVDVVADTPYVAVRCPDPPGNPPAPGAMPVIVRPPSFVYDARSGQPVGGPRADLAGVDEGALFSDGRGGIWAFIDQDVVHLVGDDLHVDQEAHAPLEDVPRQLGFEAARSTPPAVVADGHIWMIECDAGTCLQHPEVVIAEADPITGAVLGRWRATSSVGGGRMQYPDGLTLQSADANGFWYAVHGTGYRVNRS